jgi:DNA helicase-2/ATP-dependent DNA helicase PcrA
VLNTPPRGIGAKTVEALLKVAEAVDDSPSQVLLDLAEAKGSRLAEKFSRRAASVLTQFGAMLAGLRAAQPRLDLVSIIDRVIDESDYRSYIDDGTEEGSDRWANVLELRAVAEEFKEVGLTTFLEHVALISDQDTLTEAQNAPTLLTLHAAKGLEFPVVIIVGLDEGILPHQRSFEDPEAMAEERRLFYVGITRAMDRLILARTFRRRIFGRSELPEPSRYLADLPPEIVRGDLVTFQRQKESAYQQQTRWDSSQLVEKEPVFHVGMRVQHTKFGEGIVMDSRVQQDDEEVTVAFEEVGIKRLAASIAKLELLE